MATRPLTEGKINKGGRNAFPSQVTERPAPPAPSNPRSDPVEIDLASALAMFKALWTIKILTRLGRDQSLVVGIATETLADIERVADDALAKTADGTVRR